ncbi:hypothetical protein TNCV_2372521 [Trichonephila clavipes]|nr:hypothetical protein TNCV_2372521 [Trichonephila clavipes]
MLFERVARKLSVCVSFTSVSRNPPLPMSRVVHKTLSKDQCGNRIYLLVSPDSERTLILHEPSPGGNQVEATYSPTSTKGTSMVLEFV